MKIVRELIYKDKPLTAFDIDSEGSIYYALFEELIKIQTYCGMNENVEDAIKQAFNDACFLCTVILNIYQRPYLKISELRSLLQPTYLSTVFILNFEKRQIMADNYEKIVLAIVYCQLNSIEGIEDIQKYVRTLAVLEKLLGDDEPNGCEYFEDFLHACQDLGKQLSMNDFQYHEALSCDIENINWNYVTDGFKIETIKEIARSDYLSVKTKLMIIDLIEAKARELEKAGLNIPFPF